MAFANGVGRLERFLTRIMLAGISGVSHFERLIFKLCSAFSDHSFFMMYLILNYSFQYVHITIIWFLDVSVYFTVVIVLYKYMSLHNQSSPVTVPSTVIRLFKVHNVDLNDANMEKYLILHMVFPTGFQSVCTFFFQVQYTILK